MDIVPSYCFSTLLHPAPNPAHSASSLDFRLGTGVGRLCRRLGSEKDMKWHLTPDCLWEELWVLSCHGEKCASLKSYNFYQVLPQIVTLFPYSFCALTYSFPIDEWWWGVPCSHLCSFLFNTPQIISLSVPSVFHQGFDWYAEKLGYWVELEKKSEIYFTLMPTVQFLLIILSLYLFQKRV